MLSHVSMEIRTTDTCQFDLDENFVRPRNWNIHRLDQEVLRGN
jgi:hypothetical protein